MIEPLSGMLSPWSKVWSGSGSKTWTDTAGGALGPSSSSGRASVPELARSEPASSTLVLGPASGSAGPSSVELEEGGAQAKPAMQRTTTQAGGILRVTEGRRAFIHMALVSRELGRGGASKRKRLATREYRP